MAIITKDRLSALTQTKLGAKAFSSTLNEVKSQYRASAATTVFLSHSHKDLEEGHLDKAIVLLSRSGVTLYIDSKDDSLPPVTSGETATKLKQRIRANDKFILLATNRAISSKWCNWELGFGDAVKNIEKVALFPISENNGTWDGAEYLNIYPRIEESNFLDDYFKVIAPSGLDVSLQKWLQS